MDLKDKVALITGGTQGIGQAIAEEFLKSGAQVAITGRDLAKTQAAAAALSQATGGVCVGLAADVANAAQVEALFAGIQERFKQLNVVVNNAGITKDGLLMRMSEEDWDSVLATNLKGAFLVSKAACRPLLKAKGGSIICVSSVVGVAGNPGQANYAASKAGLIGFTKSLAKELASRSVRVNVVAPGFIRTAMTDDLTDEAKKALLDQIPLGRFGESQEIASVCSFLASDASRYITGQVLRVDGGMMM
ncbi:MAG TPA: 3-oxoacyl-[acyl-carrier-protein] reductase [bacterium]|jgi:3-oxoacyl-[acyl-carrier protein] reductase|nr:3-oxoacyl-[acyl-carrier-protein] reductase [bacterium]